MYRSLNKPTATPLAAWLLGAWIAAAAVTAAASDSATESGQRPWVDGGSVGVSFRYRYEFVDDDAFAEDAHASTLRSRLWLQSGTHRDLAFLIEFEDVRELWVDDFNAGGGNTPGRTRYPVVADPEGTEVNQAYVDYLGVADLRLRLGRQRILLDEQRFVGGVGWRQNEQTYDALSATWERDGISVFYAAVENVNRIFGDDVADGDHRQDPTHLLHVSTALTGIGTLSAYHLAIDNEDQPAFSTRTTGLRLQGSRAAAERTLSYLAEYATQADLADNPQSYRADYWHLRAGIGADDWTVDAGWEVLDGDADRSGRAFRTPLATLHAFNGWADQFGTTPDAGLDDRYLKAAATPGPWTLGVRAHRFRGADGGGRLGDELDLQVGRRFADKVDVDVFAAVFDGANGRADVTKLWLMLSVAF
ncbi:MAG: alginate export family protein [Pseudomonadales bacterium]